MNHRAADKPDADPDDLEWWTNLPELVGKLQRLLRDAGEELVVLRRGRNTNRKLIAAAVAFNVAVMLLFGHLFDQRDDRRRDDIRAIRQEFYNQCSDIRSNAQRINVAVDNAIASVRADDLASPAERAARIQGWEELRQTPPTCHPPDNKVKPNDQGGIR